MAFFRKPPKREFKLRKHSVDERGSEENSPDRENKYVSFEKPDRSRYPRILDYWPIFVLMGILVLFLLLVLKFLGA